MCDQSTACTVQVEHHQEGAPGYTWSYKAYTRLLRIDDEKCHTQTHPQLETGNHWLHGQVVKGVYRQQSTTLQNSTKKLAGQNPESISQEAIYHGTLTVPSHGAHWVDYEYRVGWLYWCSVGWLLVSGGFTVFVPSWLAMSIRLMYCIG